MAIYFYNEEAKYTLRSKKKIKVCLEELIAKEKNSLGEITYIFTTDKLLLKKNKEYLKHNTLTDIITFNYNVGKVISGDVFISIERVKENAKKYEISFQDEMYRVMSHGILHLCGYNDKTEKQKKKMREMEAKWIKKLKSI